MAKDKFHDNVRIALQKEGWSITAEQMRIDFWSLNEVAKKSRSKSNVFCQNLSCQNFTRRLASFWIIERR
jgi:ABC-type antimicrobial peptide transport system ATPase subunit